MADDVRRRRAEQQPKRRLSRRGCGNPKCQENAVTMLDWDQRQIAICQRCLDRLQPSAPINPTCGNPGWGEKADDTLDWGGTEIAICRNCIDLLQPLQPINPICGNPGCGEDADYTLDWGGRLITICQVCEDHLRPAPPIDRSCVGEEIRHHWSMEFRSAQTKPRLSEKLRECWEWLLGL